MNKQTEHGGVFFYILIAVVLLAALSYSVARNNRGNTELLTDEQARIAVSEILEQTNLVTSAYQKLLLRGFHEEEISFESNQSAPDYTNAKCTQNACKMFQPEGGSLNWIDPPPSANDGAEWFYTGHAPIWQAGGSNARYDLTMLLPNINERVCKELNIRLGITSTLSEAIPIVNDLTLWINQYSGTIATGSNYISGTNITGKQAVCVEMGDVSGHINATGASDNAYYFVHSIFLG